MKSGMLEAARDRRVYSLARDFLLQFESVGVNEAILDKYLNYPKSAIRHSSLADIMGALLESAQNANMRAGVVGKAIGGVEKLRPVLCEFDPHRITKRFGGSADGVLGQIEVRLRPRGKLRREPRSIWPLFCRTIVDSARFLAQFSSAAEFYEWVDCFDRDPRKRAALPLLLEAEIRGLGFALACDFLKEMGYVDYAKPDVHLRVLFEELGLCPRDDDYTVFKAILRVARNVEKDPYNVDKLFWLIGSGNFYDDPGIGKNGKIRGHRAEFIEWARTRLG